jgi:hypothetical protein
MIRMELCEYCGQMVPQRCDNPADAEDCTHWHAELSARTHGLRACYGPSGSAGPRAVARCSPSGAHAALVT